MVNALIPTEDRLSENLIVDIPVDPKKANLPMVSTDGSDTSLSETQFAKDLNPTDFTSPRSIDVKVLLL